nr:MAG TPA: hypothetical protein [Caudoviricetes sp.]
MSKISAYEKIQDFNGSEVFIVDTSDGTRTVTYQQLVDLIKSTGGTVIAQSKTVTPSTVSQTVEPDDGYNALSSVTVAPIPVLRSENEKGTTVSIG